MAITSFLTFCTFYATGNGMLIRRLPAGAHEGQWHNPGSDRRRPGAHAKACAWKHGCRGAARPRRQRLGWTADEATSFALLDAFVAAGGNLIDTADSYSRWAPGNQGGESETVIGRWIEQRGRHDDVVIATKVGSDMGLGHKVPARDYILRAAEASLRRLKVDAHRPVPVALGRRRRRRSRRRSRRTTQLDEAGQGAARSARRT